MNLNFWTRTPPPASDDCGTIDPLLSLYADGMASAEESPRVEAHLLGCSACRESLAWMRATQRALAARPVVSPSADLRARIASAIAASSTAPVPALFQARPGRAFSVRPAYAVAASLTLLGAVAVSYGLLHTPAPDTQATTATHIRSASPIVADVPRVRPSAPILSPMTIPGGKPHVAHHPSTAPHSTRLNPDRVAHVQPDEAPPEPSLVKTPMEAVHRAKPLVQSAPLMASAKVHPSLIRQSDLPRRRPEMIAMTKHSDGLAETHKPLVVPNETRKPETVAKAQSDPPVPISIGAPSIKSDPAPTVAVAGSHEGHFQVVGLLGPVQAYLRSKPNFTHSTIGRTDRGLTLAANLSGQGEKAAVPIAGGSF